MASTTWTWKSGNGDFNTAANWSGGLVPGAQDQGSLIGASGTPLIVTVGSADPALTVNALSLFDATLGIAGGALTVGSISTGNDTLSTPLSELSVAGGSLTIQQGSTIGNPGNTQVTALTQTGGSIVFQNGSSTTSYLQGGHGGVLQSAGTIEVDAGILQIDGNSSFSGTLAAVAGGAAGSTGTLDLAGGNTYNFNSGVKLNVREVELQGSGTTLQINAGMTDQYLFVEGSNTTIQLLGNTLTLGYVPNPAGSVQSSLGGTIGTSGTVLNTGSIDDSGLTLQGSAVFANKGAASQSSAVAVGGGAMVQNTGTYVLATSGSGAITGTGTVVNSGLFENTSSANALSGVTALFNSTGTVTALSGIIDFANNDTFGGAIAGAGLVEFSGGGNYTLNPGIQLSVASLYVSSSGSGNSNLQVNVLGSLSYGGVFTQDSDTIIQLLPGSLNGTAEPATLSLGNTTDVVGGTFIGATGARLVLSAAAAASSTAALSDNNLIVRGAMTVEDAGRINQGGTVTVGLLSGDGPQLVIDKGAIYDLNAQSAIIGDGTITNSGTFEQDKGVTGTSVVSTYFISNGATVLCQNGTLRFTGNDTFGGAVNGGGTVTAAGAINGNGTIVLSGAAFTLGKGLIVGVADLQVASGAQVSLQGNLTYANAFQQSSGTTLSLTSAKTLTLSGISTLGGTISGLGLAEVVVTAAGTATPMGTVSDSGLVLTGSATLLDLGVVRQQGGVVAGVLGTDNAGIQVAAGAEYDLTAVSNISGNGYLVNAGLFDQSSSVPAGSTSTVSIHLTSTGTVEADGGTLQFTGGDIFSGLIVGVGAVQLSSADFTLAAGVKVTVGTLTVAGSADVGIMGALTYANAFTLNSNTTLSLAAGATLTLTGANDYIGGTITGGAASVVSLSASAGVSANGMALSGNVTLNDNGLIGQQSNVAIGVLGNDSARLDITTVGTTVGTYDIKVASNISGNGQIVNNGTFEQDVSVVGSSSVGTNITSAGAGSTVIVAGGTLGFAGGGTFGGAITGAGELQLNDSAYTFNNGLALSVATIDINSGAAVTLAGTLASAYVGVWTLESNTTLFLNGGVLTLNNARDALHGTIDGIGTAASTIACGPTASWSTQGLVLAGNAAMTDAGYMGQQGGTLTLGVTSAATLTIASTGTYDFRQASTISGSGTIVNNGLLGQGAGGSVGSLVTTQFTNNSAGVVVCNSGTIEFGATDRFNGTIAGSGLIELSGGTFALVGSTTSGTTTTKGLVLSVSTFELGSNLGAAMVTVQGTLGYGGYFTQASSSTVALAANTTMTLSNGTDILDGTFTGQSTSVLLLGPGISSSDDGLTVSGGMEMLDAGDVGQTQTLTLGVQSGDHSNLTVSAKGTYELKNSASINGTGFIYNAGTFLKYGTTGTSTIAPTVTNETGGNMTASAGMLVFATSMVNNGTITALTGGTVDFAGAVSATPSTKTTTYAGTIAVGTVGTAIFANAVGITETVSFADASGHVSIAQATNFQGTFANFQATSTNGTVTHSDSIDLTGISSKNLTESYAGTSTSGVLILTATANGLTTTVAQLDFAGNYTIANFNLGADASGSGTLITDPPGVANITAANTTVSGAQFTDSGTGIETAMLAPAGNGVEQVFGFRANGLDVLDLKQLLANAAGDPTLTNIGNYITATHTDGNTTLAYDPAGHGHGSAFAVLQGATATIGGLVEHHALSLT